jgi:hypothetical protein
MAGGAHVNQPTHAWLAVEAYRKILAESKTPGGRARKLDGLATLLGDHLCDVVVAAWLPDSLIKDMTYGHIFKNAPYSGDQAARFTLSKAKLTSLLPSNAQLPGVAFDLVPDDWWEGAYRVKPNGGHCPARVMALSQSARDMFRMGDEAVVALTGIPSAPGCAEIAEPFLYPPRHIASVLWMMSHYIADGHMPLHCDGRALASTAKQHTHSKMETLWGKQVPGIFDNNTILDVSADDVLAAPMPQGSHFEGIDFSGAVPKLRGDQDPWVASVFACRGSFAASLALVPPTVAPVDDQVTEVGLDDILAEGFCGEERFWVVSRAVMADAANAVAMMWQDAWIGAAKPGES